MYMNNNYNPVIFIFGTIIGFMVRDLLIKKYEEIKYRRKKEWNCILDNLIRMETKEYNRRLSPPPSPPSPTLSTCSSYEDEDFISIN